MDKGGVFYWNHAPLLSPQASGLANLQKASQKTTLPIENLLRIQ